MIAATFSGQGLRKSSAYGGVPLTLEGIRLLFDRCRQARNNACGKGGEDAMSTPRADEELYREFLRYLHARRRERRSQSPLDPFALLERLIRGALSLLERTVTRLIYSIKR